MAATNAIYQHHFRTAQADLETDLQDRELGFTTESNIFSFLQGSLFYHLNARETVSPYWNYGLQAPNFTFKSGVDINSGYVYWNDSIKTLLVQSDTSALGDTWQNNFGTIVLSNVETPDGYSQLLMLGAGSGVVCAGANIVEKTIFKSIQLTNGTYDFLILPSDTDNLMDIGPATPGGTVNIKGAALYSEALNVGLPSYVMVDDTGLLSALPVSSASFATSAAFTAYYGDDNGSQIPASARAVLDPTGEIVTLTVSAGSYTPTVEGGFYINNLQDCPFNILPGGNSKLIPIADVYANGTHFSGAGLVTGSYVKLFFRDTIDQGLSYTFGTAFASGITDNVTFTYSIAF